MSLAWNQYDCRRTARSRRGGRARAERRAIRAELRDVLKPDNLWAVLLKMAARNGQAPGVDGVRYDDLSKGEWFELFRQVRTAILAGIYQPQPARLVNIAKTGGANCFYLIKNFGIVLLSRIKKRMHRVPTIAVAMVFCL